MVNRSKNIGTAGETAVVRYLRDCGGWPNAERRALAGSERVPSATGAYECLTFLTSDWS